MMNYLKQDSVTTQSTHPIPTIRRENEGKLANTFDVPSDIPLEIITFQTPHMNRKPLPIKTPTVSDGTSSTSTVAMEPSPHDILLRKTETSSKNPGNIRFHAAAKLAAEDFHNAVGRSEKLTIAQALASAVRASGGRFLDFNGAHWYEIEESLAIRKCLNELRSQEKTIIIPVKAESHDDALQMTKSNPVKISERKNLRPAATMDNRAVPMEAPSSSTIMSSNEAASSGQNNMTGAATATATSAADESTRNLPSRPPPADGLSRMLSIGRMFQSNDSAANLFASNDSIANHLRSELFRSGVSVDLPPLSIESEVGQGPEATAAVGESTDAAQNSNQDPQPAESTVPIKAEADSEVDSTQQPPALSNSGEITADLTKSQNSLLQSLVNKMSQGAESLTMSSSSNSSKQASTLDSKPAGSLPETGGAKRTSSGPNVGIFTSREWGTDLGPFQEVDVKDVFQSTINMGDKGARGSASTKVSEDQKKPSKKTRDWNALVMENLNNSIAKTALPPKPKAAATPADAALFALAAASQERLIEQVEHEKTETLASPKKRGRSRNQESLDAGKVFVEPTDEDVLLGRGGRTNNHPGNKKYLEAKDAMQSRYLAADKNAKTPISQELVDIVKKWGGRFLKLDADSNQWYEIDNLTARKKASQTLREINTPEERALKRAKYAK